MTWYLGRLHLKAFWIRTIPKLPTLPIHSKAEDNGRQDMREVRRTRHAWTKCVRHETYKERCIS